MTRNPRFVRELEARVGGKEAVVLLLCRSGKRSAAAAEAAAKAGFTQVFNVLEGFEGEIDAQQHRGGSDGWAPPRACPGCRTEHGELRCGGDRADPARHSR